MKANLNLIISPVLICIVWLQLPNVSLSHLYTNSEFTISWNLCQTSNFPWLPWVPWLFDHGGDLALPRRLSPLQGNNGQLQGNICSHCICICYSTCNLEHCNLAHALIRAGCLTLWPWRLPVFCRLPRWTRDFRSPPRSLCLRDGISCFPIAFCNL